MTPVCTHDGLRLVIRPIEPEDKQALAEGFAQLSEQSRYTRFLAPVVRLTPQQLAFLTEVDHHDHEALVAATEDGGEPVGVARYVRSTEDPTVAEAAVTVIDRWQNRGVGSALLDQLSRRAREEGIERFTATVLADNRAVIDLLQRLGPTETLRTDGPVRELRVELPCRAGRGTPLARALSAAAVGQICLGGLR